MRKKLKIVMGRCAPALFAILFYISPFFSIPYTELDISDFLQVKRIVFLTLFVVMMLTIDWGRVKFGVFFVCCIGWLTAHLIGLLIHHANFSIYMLRVGQGLFVYVFVVFLSQQEKMGFFVQFDKWFKPQYVSLTAIFLIGGALYDPRLLDWIQEGFSGNRVNLSIWLAQSVFLIYFFYAHHFSSDSTVATIDKHSKILFIKSLIFAFPIIGLQVFASGRIGLLASAIICIYFSVMALNILKGVTLACTYLAITISFFVTIAPTKFNDLNSATRGFNTSPLVNESLASVGMGPISLYDQMDKLSSFRLSIFFAGLDLITTKVLLIGLGVGNYLVDTMHAGKWQMHNVFLNHLGELGILGFIPLVCIALLPLIRHPVNTIEASMQLLVLIWIAIATMQPELLLSQVSTSLIYWAAFAYLLKDRLSH